VQCSAVSCRNGRALLGDRLALLGGLVKVDDGSVDSV